MKVLVTGASGFVGSHICERLHNLGHEVYAQIRNRNKFDFFRIPGKCIPGILHYEEEHPWIKNLPQDLDVVVHTAGIIHAFNTEDFSNINAASTRQLIEDLKKRYSQLTFLLISSLAAVGPSDNLLPRKEEHLPRPVSAYGRSKLAAEEWLNQLSPNEWKNFILRPPVILGPRDPGMFKFFSMTKKGIVPMPGLASKEKNYSYICVYDLVEIVRKILERPDLENQTFFASYPQSINLKELLSHIAKQIGCSPPIILGLPHLPVKIAAHTLAKINCFYPLNIRLTPDRYLELIPSAWTCSSEKSQKLLGLEYHWNVHDTIEVTLEDYQKRGLL